LSQNSERKIGRNEPCPCGSGLKFKKCHGSGRHTNNRGTNQTLVPTDVKKRLEQIKAQQKQREQQQGLGRPIISTVFKGYRLVAVGNRACFDKEENWKTFPSFLNSYVIQVFGKDWGSAELKKKPAERHPIIQWYDHVCKEQKKASRQKGELIETPMTGAMFAYLTLAYNLYLIAHNVHLVHGEGLHARLVARLKNQESFYPAFHETMVAASFIKAGFTIELENEEDSELNHAEFTATSPKTKKKYSVEAKHRQAGKKHTGISKQLYKALKREKIAGCGSNYNTSGSNYF